MIRDIFYVLQSWLYVPCVIAALWRTTNLLNLDWKTSLLLNSLAVPLFGLAICHIVSTTKHVIFGYGQFNDLPPDAKYSSAVLWCTMCSTAYPSSLFSYSQIFLLVPFFLWIQLNTAYVKGALNIVLEDGIGLKEFTLSTSLSSWFLTVLLTNSLGHRFGMIGLAAGIVSGTAISFFVLPLLVMVATAAIQSFYRLFDHEFFILNENGKYELNRIVFKSLEIARLEKEITNHPGKEANYKLARLLLERLEKLYTINKEISKAYRENRILDLAEFLGQYKRCMDYIHEFLEEKVSVEESAKFHNLQSQEELSDSSFKTVMVHDARRVLPHLQILVKAINAGEIEIRTKVTEHKRYLVLHKLYELNSMGSGAAGVAVDDLATRLRLPLSEVHELITYWAEKELVEENGSCVRLTSVGTREIGETIQHPQQSTRYFPPNIVEFMDYKHGLDLLRAQVEGTNRYQDFLLYEARLLENLTREQKYGSTETVRAERAQITESLNLLATEVLKTSFNDLSADRVPSERELSVSELTVVHQLAGKPTPGSIPLPVRTQTQDLPFNELTPSQFEALCVALIEVQPVTINCNLYGVSGDAQKGIDIVALQRGVSGNETWAYQCKRYREYSAGKLNEAFDKISYDADFFVLMLSVPATAALRQVAEARANTFLWDGKDIARKLKNYPVIVEDFFGPAWRQAFC